MNYVPPLPIELTESEAALYGLVPKEMKRVENDIANAMESLVVSILSRGAVPEIRLRLFDDPRFAERNENKSCKQVFESNGTFENAIFRHGNFIPYLHHFINGPDLPEDVIDGLCKILNDDIGTSAMVLDQCVVHARKSIRNHGLKKRNAARQFFLLCVEIGLELQDIRSLRDAIMS